MWSYCANSSDHSSVLLVVSPTTTRRLTPVRRLDARRPLVVGDHTDLRALGQIVGELVEHLADAGVVTDHQGVLGAGGGIAGTRERAPASRLTRLAQPI